MVDVGLFLVAPNECFVIRIWIRWNGIKRVAYALKLIKFKSECKYGHILINDVI